MMDRDILGWNVERLPGGLVREVILLKPSRAGGRPRVVLGPPMRPGAHMALPTYQRLPESKKMDLEGYLDALRDDAIDVEQARLSHNRRERGDGCPGDTRQTRPRLAAVDLVAGPLRRGNTWHLTGGLAHRRWVRGGG